MIQSSLWPILSYEELQTLSAATEQVHRAAQYLAMAGKFFLPHQPDDSHTNMGWNRENQRFEGHPLPLGHRLALQPEGLILSLLDESDTPVADVSLFSQTQQAGVEWVKEQLKKVGMDPSAYKIDLHYDIPDHEIHHGAPFQALLPVDYAAFSKARTVGALVMTDWADRFEHASEVRTWPHHFDIGSYIPLILDEAGEVSKSITIGLAIEDAYVPEYYFYITHWSRAGGISYESLLELPACGFWNPKDFTGAILRLPDLIKDATSPEQISHISVFMEEGIRASLELLDLKTQDFLL